MKSLVKQVVLILCLAASAYLGGCAAPATRQVPIDQSLVLQEAEKQREIAFEEEVYEQKRLNRISYPLLVSAMSFCSKQVLKDLGYYFANVEYFKPEFRKAAKNVLGIDSRLEILQISPGSPAENVGLKEDDIIMSIGSNTVSTGEGAVEATSVMMQKALSTLSEVVITVQRDGKVLTYKLTPVQRCDYTVLLVKKDDINAFADGKRVLITSGMLRFVRDDKELSVVISHEIAHNAMGHMSKKKQNYALGSILDVVAAVYGVNTQGSFGNIGAGIHSRGFEAEADYVGLYIMAKADQDISGTPNFWRRMATAHPGSIKRGLAASHPATPERYLALERTIEEIARKRAANEPLEPVYKKPNQAVTSQAHDEDE